MTVPLKSLNFYCAGAGDDDLAETYLKVNIKAGGIRPLVLGLALRKSLTKGR